MNYAENCFVSQSSQYFHLSDADVLEWGLRCRIPLTPAHVLRTIAPTTGLSLESRHRVGPLDSAERLTALGSYSFWLGFHITDVFMEVNENPGRKVQLFRTDLFASDLVGTAKRERNSNNY